MVVADLCFAGASHTIAGTMYPLTFQIILYREMIFIYDDRPVDSEGTVEKLVTVQSAVYPLTVFKNTQIA